MLATSFLPNTNELDLDKAGVNLDRGGFVEIDETMATNVPGIWAVGDVTGKLMLAHVGMAMGVVCAEKIAGLETEEINYQNMPRATYCHPQVASFGMSEQTAIDAGHEVAVGKFNFQANGKALGLNDYAGRVKIIADKKSGEILGAHLIGPEVTELLPELTLAQRMELTPTEIGHNVHAHPTLSEVLHEAAKAVSGEALRLKTQYITQRYNLWNIHQVVFNNHDNRIVTKNGKLEDQGVNRRSIILASTLIFNSVLQKRSN